MSRFGVSIAVIALAAMMVSPRTASAYDAENTHRWIARQAVELLVETYPGEYDELLDYVDQIVEGAFHEDDYFLDGDDDPVTLRVMRHFYRPTDKHGLSFGDYGEFPNSYEWNGVQSTQNEWDWFDGLDAFQLGDYQNAYFIAGHTLHLIADATVPAHTHLDEHGPPNGDDYEDYCSTLMDSPFEGRLKSPAPGSQIPNFDSLEQAFQLTAMASYYRNLYPGSLPEEGDASGVLAEMFPDIGKGFLSGEWEIPGIGRLGKGFLEDEPGFFYLRRNEAPSHIDVIDYDPLRPELREYGPVDESIPVVARMADDLVPVAILNSAGALKLFVDTARSLPYLGPDESEPEEPGGLFGGCSTNGQGSAAGFLPLLLASLLLRRRRR
jgi:uncharacterized protein (TIGR03382 family)